MSNQNPQKSAKSLTAGFGGRLRAAISKTFGERGIAEFCRRSGLPRRTVDNYVMGISVPNAERLRKIAEALTVDWSWLYFGSEGEKVIGAGSVAEEGPRYGLAARLERAERMLKEVAEIVAEVKRELGEKPRR